MRRRGVCKKKLGELMDLSVSGGSRSDTLTLMVSDLPGV